MYQVHRVGTTVGAEYEALGGDVSGTTIEMGGKGAWIIELYPVFIWVIQMTKIAPDGVWQSPYEVLILWEKTSYEMVILIDEYHYTTHAQLEKQTISFVKPHNLKLYIYNFIRIKINTWIWRLNKSNWNPQC